MSKLRWKREPAETGLRAVGAAPRSYRYWDGVNDFATVSPNGGGWRSEQKGWYWWARVGDAWNNTANNPVATVEEAKEAAVKWVKEHLS